MGTRRSVALWLKGIAEPVRARAEIGVGGVVVKADLPFLELHSTVGVQTGEHAPRLQGYIRGVTFASGEEGSVPQLCVDVAFSDASSIAQLEPPPAARAQLDDTVSVAVERPVARGAARGSRFLGWLLTLVVGAVCGAGVAFAWLAPRLPTLEDAHRLLRSAAAASAPKVARRARAAAVRAPLVPVMPMVTVPADPPVPPVSLDRYDLLAPRSAGDEAGALAAAESTWSSAVAHAQAAAAAMQLPQVSVHGAQTHVFVPMRGDGTGMRQHELTTPGVAVTLPRARALIPVANYKIERGIVRRVWLRREGGGVQVRVITRRTATRAAASYDETGLSIVLEP